jgi:uncharacterized protein
MSRPGVEVYSAASSPASGVPTDTSVLFMVGEAAQGPTTPTRVTSLDEWTAKFGGRVAGSYSYDSVDAFFHEGGGQCYFTRAADGTAPATGVSTSVVAASTLEAASDGAWGNELTLNVTANGSAAQTMSADSGDGGDGGGSGGKSKAKSAPDPRDQVADLLTFDAQAAGPTFVATVGQAGKPVQVSGALTDAADLIAFLAGGNYLRMSATDTTVALAAGDVTLAGGDDGTIPASAPVVVASILSIVPELGPGQLTAPWATDPTVYAALLAASSTGNRVAFLDGKVTDGPLELTSTAALLRGAEQDRYGSLWGPWAVIPGLAPGTSRQVPWSPVQAALCARNDEAGNPNQAAAGAWGECQYVTDLVQAFTPDDCEALLYAGVDTARSVYGTIQAYAFRTLVDPAGPRSGWLELNWARLNMAIVAESEAIGQEYVFAQLDGRGHTIAAFGGELAGMLAGYYTIDALFGDDVTDAFYVNVGPAVNTIEKLADGVLSAVLTVRMSPHAELVQITIVKQPITVALAA